MKWNEPAFGDAKLIPSAIQYSTNVKIRDLEIIHITMECLFPVPLGACVWKCEPRDHHRPRHCHRRRLGSLLCDRIQPGGWRGQVWHQTVHCESLYHSGVDAAPHPAWQLYSKQGLQCAKEGPHFWPCVMNVHVTNTCLGTSRAAPLPQHLHFLPNQPPSRPHQGEIYILSPLDRETKDHYTLTAIARDNPGGKPNNRRENSVQVKNIGCKSDTTCSVTERGGSTTTKGTTDNINK